MKSRSLKLLTLLINCTTVSLLKSCSKCDKPRRVGGRLCLEHHAESCRISRKKSIKDISLEERIKMRARWYVRTYIKRGKVKREPCEVCGNIKSEAHHEDYFKPLDVKWLCRRCHEKVHHG